MAGKIKKTRPELLRQRRLLAQFKRYLPTLTLKKQQIQSEILKLRNQLRETLRQMQEKIDHVDSWTALFSESLPGPITRLVKVAEVKRRDQNIAGITLPFLDSVTYEILPYSRRSTPLWVDCGVEIVKELMELREKAKVMQDAEKVLQHELRKVTQRLNLFEKVKIPQSQEAIRVIRIALADEQTAGVGRAKIAKAKTQAEPTTGASS